MDIPKSGLVKATCDIWWYNVVCGKHTYYYECPRNVFEYRNESNSRNLECPNREHSASQVRTTSKEVKETGVEKHSTTCSLSGRGGSRPTRQCCLQKGGCE